MFSAQAYLTSLVAAKGAAERQNRPQSREGNTHVRNITSNDGGLLAPSELELEMGIVYTKEHHFL